MSQKLTPEQLSEAAALAKFLAPSQIDKQIKSAEKAKDTATVTLLREVKKLRDGIDAQKKAERESKPKSGRVTSVMSEARIKLASFLNDALTAGLASGVIALDAIGDTATMTVTASPADGAPFVSPRKSGGTRNTGTARGRIHINEAVLAHFNVERFERDGKALTADIDGLTAAHPRAYANNVDGLKYHERDGEKDASARVIFKPLSKDAVTAVVFKDASRETGEAFAVRIKAAHESGELESIREAANGSANTP